MSEFKYSGAGFYQLYGGGRAWIACDLSENGFEGDICIMGYIGSEPCKNVGWQKNGVYLNYPSDGTHSFNLLGKLHE